MKIRIIFHLMALLYVIMCQTLQLKAAQRSLALNTPDNNSKLQDNEDEAILRKVIKVPFRSHDTILADLSDVNVICLIFCLVTSMSLCTLGYHCIRIVNVLSRLNAKYKSVLMILFLVAIWPCEGSPSTAEIFKRVKVSHQNLCNDLDEERKTCETDLFAKSFETSPYSCEFLLQVLNCSRPWLRNFCVEDPRLSQIQQRTYLIFKMKDQYPEFESCVPSSEKEGCVANQVMVEARNGTKDPLTGIELKKNFTGLALACNDRVTRVADNLSLYLEHAW
ncbi:hypothetical protein TCAL_15987 [Tigriopus californicus]|uniref:DUF19 domain-containing protein n=1 Tax=Tigriopus californicus TaxID=6832 RepID=A0A553PFN5_TIGCA|nr:hypothetical protein TCAL_15987 [Tigriopus californicus]